MEASTCGHCGRPSRQFTEALVNGVPKTVCVVCAVQLPKVNANESSTVPRQQING